MIRSAAVTFVEIDFLDADAPERTTDLTPQLELTRAAGGVHVEIDQLHVL